MESSISKSVSLLILLMVLACQAIGLAEVVDIPDPNLRKALGEALQIGAGEEITIEALAKLKELKAENRKITDFSGLEHCTSLNGLAKIVQ